MTLKCFDIFSSGGIHIFNRRDVNIPVHAPNMTMNGMYGTTGRDVRTDAARSCPILCVTAPEIPLMIKELWVL